MFLDFLGQLLSIMTIDFVTYSHCKYEYILMFFLYRLLCFPLFLLDLCLLFFTLLTFFCIICIYISISSSISLEVLHYACIPDDYSRSFNIYPYKNLGKFIFLFFSCSKSLGTLYILYGLYMNFILELQKEQKIVLRTVKQHGK